MIPQETVQLILDTVKIEDIVGDFVTLKRQGSSYWACCPFHNEKTPSFHVEPSRGIYKCFGCGKAGSAVGFLMDYERMSYSEALRYIANKYHIEIQEKEETAEEIAARQRHESLLVVSEFAGKFFRDQLETPEGRAVALTYFHSRGLEDETIAKYGLGWAPQGRDAFTKAAQAEGYKDEFLFDTGLCARRDDGTLYDRFYERVMFPVHSVSGRIIAFGGRTLKSDKTVAKYVNSKESEIYVKSRSLYGIYFAKNEMARQDRVYLVEGYLDVLSMHQLGILNTVASSGTSLTVEQIRLMKRFTPNVTIMYDGDSAGIHAALRGINMVLKEDMNVKIVLLPDGDDPDSFARKHTLEEVRTFIAEHEQDFISFKTDLLLEDAGRDPLKKAEVINDIADTIAGIPDAVKRSVYANDCAMKFGIESDVLFGRIRRTRERELEERRAEAARAAREGGPSGAGSVRMTEGGVRMTEEGDPSGMNPVRMTGEGGSRMTGGDVGMRGGTDGSEVLSLAEEDPIVAPSEKEILTFILRDGTNLLTFPTDSEFYTEGDPPTVAEFIDGALSGEPFVNTIYRSVYERYFELYDEGLSQDQIIRNLLDGENRQISHVTALLFEMPYQLSVKDFSNAMTAHENWLSSFVPRAILAYHDKRMQSRLKTLMRDLAAAAPEDQPALLKEIESVTALKRKINIRLGREKLER